MFERVYYTIEGRGGEGSVKFALATDLHRQLYGQHQEGLIAALEDEKPDAVLWRGISFITGGRLKARKPSCGTPPGGSLVSMSRGIMKIKAA